MKILFTVSLFLFNFCADIEEARAVDHSADRNIEPRNIAMLFKNTNIYGSLCRTGNNLPQSPCNDIAHVEGASIIDYGIAGRNPNLRNVTMSFLNCNTYIGTVRTENHLPQGFGILSIGERYVGHFDNGQIHGSGTYTWADGSYYSGNYKHGLKNGHGIMHYWNDDIYDGNWLNGKRHGYGTMTYATGIIRSYTGYWENDKEYGYGETTYSSGSVLKGMWNGSTLVYLARP